MSERMVKRYELIPSKLTLTTRVILNIWLVVELQSDAIYLLLALNTATPLPLLLTKEREDIIGDVLVLQ